MKKQYTKRQIMESIRYWKKILESQTVDERYDPFSSAQQVLPADVKSNFTKIAGAIYQFIDNIANEDPEDFDIGSTQSMAKDLIYALKNGK